MVVADMINAVVSQLGTAYSSTTRPPAPINERGVGGLTLAACRPIERLEHR